MHTSQLYYIEACGDFNEAIQEILTDEGFHMQTSRAKLALDIARSVNSFCGNSANADTVASFAIKLSEKLEGCLPTKKYKNYDKYMEKTYGAFHQFRCSDEHIKMWLDFLAKSTRNLETREPIFYQHATNFIFKQILKRKVPGYVDPLIQLTRGSEA